MAPRHLRGLLLVAGTSLLWGTTVVPAKWLLEEVTPVTLAVARLAVATTVLLPWVLWRHHRTHGFAGMRWGRLATQGSIGVALYYLVGYWGLRLTSGSHASLILAAMPLVTAVAASVTLREALTPRQWLGGVVAVAGVATIVLSARQPADQGSVVGDLLGVATMLIWAAYTVLTKKWGDDLPSLVMTAWVIALGGAFLLPVALLTLDPGELAAMATVRGAASVLYLGAAASAGGLLLWNRSLTYVPASLASLFLNLLPLVGLAASIAVLGERVSPWAMAGGLLCLAAVAWTGLAPGDVQARRRRLEDRPGER